MNNQATNIIKFLTPLPSELTVRTVVLSYSLVLTMLTFEVAISLIIILLSWLF